MLWVGPVVTLTQQHRHGCATCARHRSASLEQDALDELRYNGSNRDLHVPLLSGYPRVHWHVLHRELNFDGQTSQLHHLGQGEPDGERPDVLRRRGPVCKNIAGVPDAPALAEEDRRDGLQVHLVRVEPAVLPPDGPPLLWKHAEEDLLREVAHHDTRPSLPFALASEVRGRSGEAEGRPC